MRIDILLGSLLGMLFAPVCSLVSEETRGLAEANAEFAWNLYDAISELAEGGNMFFSPLSVSLALGMTYAGAKGDTKSQMSEVLEFDAVASDTALNNAFQELIDAFNQDQKNYTLAIANRLFGREGYNFLQEYKSVTNTYFRASLEELDFAGDPDGSRVHINNWVEDETNDKIKDLLPGGSINDATALVIINAIYFKGKWALPFEPDDTERKSFYAIDGEVLDIDMMYLEKHFNYAEVPALDSQVLEMPYAGNELSMFIILPKERQGLAAVEDKLMNFDFSEMENSLVSKTVQVSLPKFKFTQNINLKAILKEMGMEDLFINNKCDLSGMNGRRDLVVTEVVHKAYVDVNEEGTEAAGATGIIVGVTSIQFPQKFTADHPFIFYIKEKTTGSVLFIGRMTTSPDNTPVVGAFGQDRTNAAISFIAPMISWLLSTLCLIYVHRF